VPGNPVALDAGSPNQPLGPSSPRSTAPTLRPAASCRREDADCCLAGLWLLHDFLHESHELARDPHATGSFWHASCIAASKTTALEVLAPPIRDTSVPGRARSGEAGVLPQAGSRRSRRAPSPARGATTARRAEVGCVPVRRLLQSAQGDHELERACEMLQRIEWGVLFDYCFERCG